MPSVGDTLDGRDQLQAPIGAGGTDGLPGSRCASWLRTSLDEVLLPGLAADPDPRCTVRRGEARALAYQSHRAIVAV